MKLLKNLLKYKQKCFNGGTSSPLIITYGDPAKNKLAGKWTAQQAHIIDILPTCVDLADGTYPTTYKEGKALPGESLIPAIEGAEPHDRELYFEHQGSCAVIEGDWKLVRGTKDEDWQLVDLVNDPFEQEHALSRTTAKLMTTLRTDWQKWASTQNTYFRQARQCAESMGLSVTARCRIVVPQALQNAGRAGPEDGADEFTRKLRARQAAALDALRAACGLA